MWALLPSFSLYRLWPTPLNPIRLEQLQAEGSNQQGCRGQSQVDSVERSDHSHSTRPVSAQHSRGAFDGDVFPAVCATAGSPRLLLSHWDPLVKAMCSWYEGCTSDEMLIQVPLAL